MSARAILWDLDGVIVSTMEFHYKAFRQMLSEQGFTLEKEHFFGELIGLRNDAILRELLGDLTEEETGRLTNQKEAGYRRLVKGRVEALPGALELIARAITAGLRQAIVSSTPRENIDLILYELGLTGAFDAIVSGDDVSKGKPDPEGFLLASQRLGVPPADCVVVEDAPEGIAAGKAAGMRCVGVTTTREAGKLAAADLVVDRLDDPRVAQLVPATKTTREPHSR